MRSLELDRRREVGVVFRASRIAKQLADVFEADWDQASPRKKSKLKKNEKAEEEARA